MVSSNKKTSLTITLNGEKLSRSKHSMAIREMKMELMQLKDIGVLDAMDQAVFFELIELGIETYLIALQDNLLKNFESNVEH